MQPKRLAILRASLLVSCCLLWFGGVSVGLYLLIDYETTPGKGGVAPAEWPPQSRLERHPVLPTLVMLVHPRCSCSQASLEEFARLLTRFQGRVRSYVLVYTPSVRSSDWDHSALGRAAAALPDVRVWRDIDGAEAALFRVATSGYTVLYDGRGQRRFHGGITPSRGHAGDNAGSQALAALLDLHTPARQTSLVFGCDLFPTNPQTQEAL